MTALENGDANLREKSMHPLWEEYVWNLISQDPAERARKVQVQERIRLWLDFG